jgi:alpha-1,4-digalacturonate transport system permease protein
MSRLLEFLYNQFVNLLDGFFNRLQQTVGIKGMAYVFVLPNLLIFGIFILLPMILNFGYTFTGGNDLFLEERPYVGTRNLEQLFECEDLLNYRTCREDNFIRAIGNTAWFVVLQISLMILVSLVTALILNRQIKGRAFFRSVFFYPVLLSPIVVALIWRWILQENGIINAALVGLGLDTISFLTDVTWARFWVIIISVWANMGFYTLILLAGLQSIPHDLYEASAIDGANNWQNFTGITLPLLMPTMLVVIVLSTIRAVQIFDIIFAFTRGGPGTATLFIVQFIYDNGFASPSKRYGIAAAASMVMASILIVFTLVQLFLQRRRGEL